MHKVILPELGEGIKKATVTFWYHAVGETVKEGEDLVELTTDKAAFNLPSPVSGIIHEIFYQEGQSTVPGETLATIEDKL